MYNTDMYRKTFSTEVKIDFPCDYSKLSPNISEQLILTAITYEYVPGETNIPVELFICGKSTCFFYPILYPVIDKMKMIRFNKSIIIDSLVTWYVKRGSNLSVSVYGELYTSL